MTHVKLMGEIGEKFGSDWHMNAKSFRDIFKLIECQTEGFGQYIREKAEEGIDFTIQNGKDLIDNGLDLQIAPPQNTIIITPVAAGEGKLGNALKIILGVILIIYGPGWIEGAFQHAASKAAGVGEFQKAERIVSAMKAAQWGMRALGTGLAMRGVTGYLTPESPSKAGDSYLFDGPQNNVKEGIAVPLLYGRLIVGGSIMNFGFIEDKITQQQSGYTRVISGQAAPANSDTESSTTEDG